MYRQQWLQARDVVLTVPQSGHVVAGGILAAALCLDDAQTTDRHLLRPAPLLLRSALDGQTQILRQWLAAAQRPRLWIVGLDAVALEQLGGTTDLDGLRSAGAMILIGPDEHADPLQRVVAYLEQHPDTWYRPLTELEPLLNPGKAAKRKARFKILIGRGLAQEQRASADGELTAWLDERVQPFALLPAQIRAMREAWDACDYHWAPFREHFAMAAEDWNTGFLDGAAVLDTRDDEARWQVKVQGFSASAQRLRRQLGQAERQGSGASCILVAHDGEEAWRLGEELARARQQGPPQLWQDDTPLQAGVWVVEAEQEALVYAAAAWAQALVIDVPPLHERSMDVPHMAVALLGRVHRQHQRPGAPRALAQDPRLLAWLASCHWPHGSADLRAYLAGRLQADAAGDWSQPDPSLPRLPAVGHPALLQGGLASMDSLRGQLLRWAMGGHSTQAAALASLGLNTRDLPAWAWAPSFPSRRAPPRRLIWAGGQWEDPWL